MQVTGKIAGNPGVPWLMKLKVLFSLLFLAGIAFSARAQVAPSAVARQFSIFGGGTGTLFSPDYGPNHLAGVSAFVDVHFTRWVQVEAEGRWQRFHQYENINQNNYLIGPRLPIKTIWKATPYVKVLAGYSSMNFQFSYASGKFTTIEYGGGVDVRLAGRLSARGEFDYQQWPNFVEGSIYPYGASVGISYRVLGGR